MARGKFITFEGGEGCGKSTQIKRLKEALEKDGVEVVLTREPGGTWLSEEIRHLIKDQDTDAPHPSPPSNVMNFPRAILGVL